MTPPARRSLPPLSPDGLNGLAANLALLLTDTGTSFALEYIPRDSTEKSLERLRTEVADWLRAL